MRYDAGQRLSISRMILCAHSTASAIAVIVAGTRAEPGSYWHSFRSARIAAAINITRLRPSSTERAYMFRHLFATNIGILVGQLSTRFAVFLFEAK